jgi:hypothetical protein
MGGAGIVGAPVVDRAAGANKVALRQKQYSSGHR